MAKTKQRGEAAATPASDDLTFERVQRWLRDRVAQFQQWSGQHHLPTGRLAELLGALEADVERVCSGISAVESAIRHLDDAHRILDAYAPVNAPVATAPRATTASTSAPHNHERWRKRPLPEKERDDIRMDLLHARAAGPEALARAKREVVERHGISRKTMARLLNTCTGRRFALNFAARVVSRAPQAKRQAQLVVQMSNLLGLKQNAIVQAVREQGAR